MRVLEVGPPQLRVALGVLAGLGLLLGTAAAVQGTISTVGGAGLGLLVGQSYNGTTLPVALGFFGFALIAFGIVFWTERGRLFRPHHQPVQA